MSIESKIEELTAAIKEQTAVNAHLASVIIGWKNSSPPVVQETAVPEKGAKAAKPETKPETPTAVEPEKDDPKAAVKPEDRVEPAKEKTAEPEVKVPALPAGERNMQYYEKHVRPKLIEVGKQSREKLIAIGQKFGVNNCKDVPADKWDDLFAEAINALAGA